MIPESNCIYYILVSFAGRGLYQNKMLKELWVGFNDLDCVK